MSPTALTDSHVYTTVSALPNGKSRKRSQVPMSNGVAPFRPPLQAAHIPAADWAVLPDPTYPVLRDVAPRAEFAFDFMEDALEAFAHGEFLVVMDDENRENEGDLIICAAHVTTEKMAWMIRHTRCVTNFLGVSSHRQPACNSGYICISLPQSRLEELDIPMMFPNNQDRHRTAYTVTVAYKHGARI